jgi:hypothetical protein
MSTGVISPPYYSHFKPRSNFRTDPLAARAYHLSRATTAHSWNAVQSGCNDRSRDNLPNPKRDSKNPYVPTIDDLFGAFDFSKAVNQPFTD